MPDWPINQYPLIEGLMDKDSDTVIRITPWDTTIKNIHQLYQTLRYAKGSGTDNDFEYYKRAKSGLKKWGLINEQESLTESGTFFLTRCEEALSDNPNFFKENTRPFEFEYLLFKIIKESSDRELPNNIEHVLANIKNLAIDDWQIIKALQIIYNHQDVIARFNSLKPDEVLKLIEEEKRFLEEISDNGGILESSKTCKPEWKNRAKAINAGNLGNQNDGYFRSSLHFKAAILSHVEEILVEEAYIKFNIKELYAPYKTYLSYAGFVNLLFYIEGAFIDGSLITYKEEPVQKVVLPEIGFEEIKISDSEINEEIRELSPEEKTQWLVDKVKELEALAVIQRRTHRVIKLTNRATQNRRNAVAKNNILELFGFTCQVDNFSFKEKFGVNYAEVHHITPIESIENNRPSNLLIVCPNCHTMLDKGFITAEPTGDNDLLITNKQTGEKSIIPNNYKRAISF